MHTYAKFVIKCKAIIRPSAPSNMKEQQLFTRGKKKRARILNVEVQ